jgi:hypothetical protein
MSSRLDDLQNEMGTLLAGLDEATMQRHPGRRADAWSIQQIAEHLLRTYDATLSLFEERLLKGRCTKAKPSLQQRLGQLMITRLGYFPRGRKSPEFACPPATLTPESGYQVFARMTARLQALKTIFQEAENAWGQQRCVSHIAMGPMSVEQWARFHQVHGQHHAKQMAAIRTELGL